MSTPEFIESFLIYYTDCRDGMWVKISRWTFWQKLVIGFLLALWWQISSMMMDVLQWELIDKIARYP